MKREITPLSLPKDEENYGLIHADFHCLNFYIDNGTVTAFDFDLIVKSWFLVDLGAVLFTV
jgi:amicoumacin kinase